jgi:hypothetical protein
MIVPSARVVQCTRVVRRPPRDHADRRRRPRRANRPDRRAATGRYHVARVLRNRPVRGEFRAGGGRHYLATSRDDARRAAARALVPRRPHGGALVSAIDPRPRARTRRRPALAVPERLEGRTLLAYTPLGSSLPDLTVRGATPPVAAYSGNIGVAVDLSNLGASSMTEPMALFPGAPSTADAGPSAVGVYLSTDPHKLDLNRAIRIGQIDAPTVRQNSTLNLKQVLPMPETQPAGFPGNGGLLYVWFRADDLDQVNDMDRTNNVALGAQPVQLAAPLPELAIVGFEAPPGLSPGDTINPTFQIANFGTVDTAPQGDVLVYLVASTDTTFGPDDLVLASYSITNVPPLALAPSFGTSVLGDATLDLPPNVLTIGGQDVALPEAPNTYFIGLIADPLRTIRQISDLTGPRSDALSEVRQVGPPIEGLPPAGQVQAPAPSTNVFPTPAYGPITSPFFPPDAFPPQTQTAVAATTLRARAQMAVPRGVRARAGGGKGGGVNFQRIQNLQQLRARLRQARLDRMHAAAQRGGGGRH